ncbi:MAG: class I SAM-dependent methyltransferase [Bryobacteraceae bacterium]
MKAGVTSTAYHAGAHCADSELLDATIACPLCGFGGERRAVLTLQRDPDIVLLDCPTCKGVSASRMPKPETLAGYYANYRQDTDLKVTFFSPAKFAGHILGLAGNLWDREVLRILDFGGADGSLAVALAEKLLSVKGGVRSAIFVDVIDFSQDPTNPKDPSITVRRLSSLEETVGASYDLAIASSVMEHIPEPNPVFRSLFRALRPGGCLYARSPFIVPVLRIFDRLGLTFDFTYPAHVHDMGKEFWEGLPGRLYADETQIKLRHSHPSPVETTFQQDPLRTMAAHLLKLPWRFAPNRYHLVGGWEVLFERTK